jgi:1-acyl-sn-glycerol-3-phosphate acyltransferase
MYYLILVFKSLEIAISYILIKIVVRNILNFYFIFLFHHVNSKYEYCYWERLHKIESLNGYSKSFNRKYEDMNLDNLFYSQPRLVDGNILKDIIEADLCLSV